MTDEDRGLTDADAEKVADFIWGKAKKEFYLNVGKGFFSLVWKGVILLMLGLAVYGSGKGWFG